ncbi:3-deoxy-manno-octulosonate cytidylyltransferase [Curvibacter sp. CHRR-16]|uniref:3-deoxy-manno-octulosonate cytidylyltransferase n=1 Tax=Curvibacter sp. CHRR-16 TaxID=2835872 RepID=UPI001BDAC825|nr:3-deoxy-manno-octulosonate cytidylyltransferase [Curvibacter sp. CHRR-16]MBT0569242.1 3-deoxy-manno-octulosonate cytidylyltransferase [Curvibacter sp. CHRR-16]
MTYTVLIPARLASTRLPNKPLADIHGQPMIVRVARNIVQGCPHARQVVVATDDDSIVQACAAHGVKAILTSKDHPSGSDRLAQACELLGLDGDDIVVNVQGDEPLMTPTLVDEVASLLQSKPDASMGTAGHALDKLEDYTNPNIVKVVHDAAMYALYFSRAPIAWWRDGFSEGQFKAMPHPAPLRHIGIYSYRARFLRAFPQLSQAPLEVTEALEQLRALWHGHRIALHVTHAAPGPGVDTPEDLDKVRALLQVS